MCPRRRFISKQTAQPNSAARFEIISLYLFKYVGISLGEARRSILFSSEYTRLEIAPAPTAMLELISYIVPTL